MSSRLRLGGWLAMGQAMPRVGWIVRSPLGWRALLAELRGAPWLGSAVAPSKLTETTARAAPKLTETTSALLAELRGRRGLAWRWRRS